MSCSTSFHMHLYADLWLKFASIWTAILGQSSWWGTSTAFLTPRRWLIFEGKSLWRAHTAETWQMCGGKAPSIEIWLPNQVTVLASPSVPLKTTPQREWVFTIACIHGCVYIRIYVYMCVVSTVYVCGACVSARDLLCTLGVAHSLTHSLTHSCMWCCSLTHSLTHLLVLIRRQPFGFGA